MNASLSQRERDLHRIAELVLRLDGEESSEVLDAEFKARTTITLSPDVLTEGQKRAREARRSFSNYIEVLIATDIAQSRSPAQQPAVDVTSMNDGSLKSKSVRLSQEQIEALERRAEEDKRDVSQVIRIALDEFFERHEREVLAKP